MKEIKIEIGSKEYTVKLAESDEDHDKGLQGVTELPENKGMLFIFSEPDEISFYMKDTHIPLDIIFCFSNTIVLSCTILSLNLSIIVCIPGLFNFIKLSLFSLIASI